VSLVLLHAIWAIVALTMTRLASEGRHSGKSTFGFVHGSAGAPERIPLLRPETTYYAARSRRSRSTLPFLRGSVLWLHS